MSIDLLTNAIEALQVGIADYETGTRSRLLSAVRNIHAGILLMYKEALRRHSPESSNEVLVKSVTRVQKRKDGSVVFVGHGRKTVGAQAIETHFQDLGIVTDWKRFWSINKIRNEVEHYYPEVTKEAMKQVVANAFILVREFLSKELSEEPLELLGADTWGIMLEVADVYEAERKECEIKLSDVEWESEAVAAGIQDLQCGKCGSDLLQPAGDAGVEPLTLECRACGSSQTIEEFAADAVAHALSWEWYLSHTDGNVLPYGTCPECNEEAYVTEEWRCAACGYEADRYCHRCSNEILIEEIDSSPYCGYCDYIMTKDD